MQYINSCSSHYTSVIAQNVCSNIKPLYCPQYAVLARVLVKLIKGRMVHLQRTMCVSRMQKNSAMKMYRIGAFEICKQVIGCRSTGGFFSSALQWWWELMLLTVIYSNVISSLICYKPIGAHFIKLHFYLYKFPRYSL